MQPFRPVVAAVRSATLRGQRTKWVGVLSPRTKTRRTSKHLGQAVLPSKALRGPPKAQRSPNPQRPSSHRLEPASKQLQPPRMLCPQQML